MDGIYYKSTRGNNKRVTASEAILKGIAEDGGLFVPSYIPDISLELEKLKNMEYKELAYFVMSKFLGDFTEEELKSCIEKAYNSKFDTEEIAPIKKVGDEFFLELFHGPTLAFKDMALTILPYLMKTSAKKQSLNEDIVILTATSGDTGKAALEGFANVEGTKIMVFFPQHGVSEVQRMQMITQKGDNTCVVGINGNFDDAQSAVKNIFSDREFNRKLKESGYVFSSANSINIGRLIPQIVYYFHGYFNILRKEEIKFGDRINVVVPTGNFGNILAAYYAKKMGLPINKLICASNDNKVICDFINTGIYNKNREFIVTLSPSMDILVSSNLERLLYIISGEDCDSVKTFMGSLNNEGSYEINETIKKNIEDFYGGFASESETLNSVNENFANQEYVIDTHTAVAHCVYKKYLKHTGDKTKTIIASTASPYKFTKYVMSAIDRKYEVVDDFQLIKELSAVSRTDIPNSIKNIESRPILHKTVCNKENIKETVSEFLKINI